MQISPPVLHAEPMHKFLLYEYCNEDFELQINSLAIKQSYRKTDYISHLDQLNIYFWNVGWLELFGPGCQLYMTCR